MPDLGQAVGDLLGFIGEQVGATSLRLGPIPTLAMLAALLVLLSLVARPTTRWMVRDLGRLATVKRAMALAAEAGGTAVFSLGSAGVARGASAFDRLQTLAALPILGHLARAAARAGVPLRVTSNDIVAAHLADVVLADAHRRTETEERRQHSSVQFIGEGRPAAAYVALTDAETPAASGVHGALGEEALLLLHGAGEGAAWTSFGTANASQAAAILLTGEGALIGPELYQAPSDVRSAGHERTGVLAANRLVLVAVAVIALGSLLGIAGVEMAGQLAGR